MTHRPLTRAAALLLVIAVTGTAGGCASRSVANHPAAGSAADPHARPAPVLADSAATDEHASPSAGGDHVPVEPDPTGHGGHHGH